MADPIAFEWTNADGIRLRYDEDGVLWGMLPASSEWLLAEDEDAYSFLAVAQDVIMPALQLLAAALAAGIIKPEDGAALQETFRVLGLLESAAS